MAPVKYKSVTALDLDRSAAGAALTTSLEAPPPPAWTNLVSAMLNKHMYTAFKRKRFFFLLPIVIYSWVSATLLQKFASVMTADMAGTALPYILSVVISTSMQSGVVDVVEEKESKMKIVQEIYGVTKAAYWSSWGAFYSVAAAVSTFMWLLFSGRVCSLMCSFTPIRLCSPLSSSGGI